MFTEKRVAIGVLFAAGLIAFAVSWFPALTTGGGAAVVTVSAEEFQKIVTQEQDHCKDNLEGVNCACFGGVSGMIQADQAPRVPSARYANKQDLARSQAEDKC